MNNRFLPLAAVAAAALLAACDGPKTEVVDTRAPDPLATQLANAAPVELPPAVKATATFRCADNSLIYVDFFQGDKLANLRTEKNGAPTRLTAENAGDALAGNGYSVKGTPTQITYTAPGKSALSCKA